MAEEKKRKTSPAEFVNQVRSETSKIVWPTREETIRTAIFVFIILAGFGVPTIWTKLAPQAPARAKSWARFQREGIVSLTGHNTAGAATVQVLILPVLIVVWGLAVVTIAALVR